MINGKPLRGQKFKGTMWTSLVIPAISRQLVEDAKLKARQQGSTLKGQITNLLTAWTYAEENVVFEEEDEI